MDVYCFKGIHLGIIFLLCEVLHTSLSSFINQQLTAVPNNIPNVATIRLEGNNITQLNRSSFQSLSALVYLYVSRNHLTESGIEPDFLVSTSVQHLYVSWNHFKAIPNITKPGLLLLDISYNRIKNDDLTQKMFISGLETLTISYNPLRYLPDINMTKSTLITFTADFCELIHLEPGYFQGFINLFYLNIKGNSISVLHDFTFRGLVKVSTINLFGTQSTVNATLDAFSDLPALHTLDIASSATWLFFPCFKNGQNLIQLSARSTTIQNITTGCTNLQSISTLDLSYTNTRSFTESPFSRAGSIGQLVLSGNGITCVTNHILQGFNTTASLTMEYNQMTEFGASQCENATYTTMPQLPRLTALKLSYNSLTHFPNISNMLNLQTLDLQSNKISHMEYNALVLSSKLQYLILANNRLTSPPVVTGACPSLISLDLTSNSISNITQNMFQGCTKLRMIFFTSNKMSNVPDFSLIGSSLQTLNLQSNIISGAMPVQFFSNLNGLTSLLMANNKITLFDFKVVQGYSSLTILDISNNKLKTVTDPVVWCMGTHCQNLIWKLEDNMLECNDDICFLKRTPSKVNTKLTCFGKDWPQVTDIDLQCDKLKIPMDVHIREGPLAVFNLTSMESGSHRKLRITSPEDCALHCKVELNCWHMEFEGLIGNAECRLFFET